MGENCADAPTQLPKLVIQECNKNSSMMANKHK